MIHDVDASIRAMVRRDAVNGSDVEVAFDAPTREWAGKRSSPTVNVYLFDIREDMARRRVEPERVRDADGTVIGRRRPPRRFRLSYLITAWTQRPEDEHRLLSSVLGAFVAHDEFPRELLQGSLEGTPAPLYVTIGLPPPAERSIGELWSAMGGELKPSLELVLSAPFAMDELLPAGPPVTEDPRFTFEDDEGLSESPAGRRRPFPGPQPTGGAPDRPDDDAVTATDGEPGDSDATDADESAPLSETVTGGGDDERGRVITIQTVD